MSLVRNLFIIVVLVAALGCKESSQQDTAVQVGVKDPACSGKTIESCSGTSDCEVLGANCSVKTAFCEKQSSEASCNKMTSSCTWNSTDSACAKKVIGPIDTNSTVGGNCSTYTTDPTCTERGCQWTQPSGPCAAKPVQTENCSGFTDQISCTAKSSSLGCRWSGTSCITGVPSTTSCESITSQTLCLAPNCNWNGYSCINQNSTVPNATCSGLKMVACFFKFTTCSWQLPSGPCGPKS
ncbi:MAG: hypothetical protein NTV34_10855 [Proteobacteria bacterium]|nr:hypothetical protein [Pseudomonadota bacterium]